MPQIDGRALASDIDAGDWLAVWKADDVYGGSYRVVKRAPRTLLDAIYASAAQGALADTAVQPEDLAAVATSGNYSDLSGLPTLGTAAAADTGDFATAAQGALAESALQPAAIGVSLQAYNGYLAGIAALTPGAPEDGYALTWDNGSSAYVLAQANPFSVDAWATLIASSPTNPAIGLTTDTEPQLTVYNGSNWYTVPLELILEQSTNPDIGPQPPMVERGLSGYTSEYITDKTLHQMRLLGHADMDESGDIRTTTAAELQIYLDGAIQTIVYGVRIREADGINNYEIPPLGFDDYIEYLSGNSQENIGLNGLPIYQQLNASMGTFPVALHLDGQHDLTTLSKINLLNKTNFIVRFHRDTQANILAATNYGWQAEPAYATDSKVLFVCDATEGNWQPVVEHWRADQTGDTAPNDDTTAKKITLQKLAAPPTNGAYIAFSNNPGTDTFYLVMEEG